MLKYVIAKSLLCRRTGCLILCNCRKGAVHLCSITVVLWDVMLCALVDVPNSSDTCCLRVDSNLKIEALGASEMLVPPYEITCNPNRL